MHISMQKLFLLVVLIGSFVPATNAQPQIRSIFGKITDDKGQPVVGALVVFQGMDFVRNMICKTNKNGDYVLLMGMQGGRFRIIVHKEGFKPAWKENVTAAVAEPREENFQLEPGGDFQTLWEMKEIPNPAISISSFVADATKLMDAGNYDEAIAALNRASAALYALLGECNEKLEKLEEARVAFENAVRFQLENPEYLTNLGIILSKLGRSKEAEEMFKRIVKADSGDPNMYRYYYELGKRLSGAPQETNRQK